MRRRSPRGGRSLLCSGAGFALCAGLGAAAPNASAAPSLNDYLIERVSPASCEPELAADRAKLILSVSGWGFVGGQTGTITLLCPIYTPYSDEESGARSIGEVRLWYADPDGTQTSARVQADLLYRTPTANLALIQAVVSSNSNPANLLTNTTYAVTPASQLMVDAQYSVRITMVRTLTSQAVNFRGVTFREL